MLPLNLFRLRCLILKLWHSLDMIYHFIWASIPPARVSDTCYIKNILLTVGLKVFVLSALSQSLSHYQTSYGHTKLELLGVVTRILDCASYLRGRKFFVECDHQALKPLFHKSLKEQYMKGGLLYYKSSILRFRINLQNIWLFAIAYQELNAFILWTPQSLVPLKMTLISLMCQNRPTKSFSKWVHIARHY